MRPSCRWAAKDRPTCVLHRKLSAKSQTIPCGWGGCAGQGPALAFDRTQILWCFAIAAARITLCRGMVGPFWIEAAGPPAKRLAGRFLRPGSSMLARLRTRSPFCFGALAPLFSHVHSDRIARKVAMFSRDLFGRRRGSRIAHQRHHRRLLVESLEDRSLLSGIPLLPQLPPQLREGPTLAPSVSAATDTATQVAISVPQDVLNGVPVTVQLTAQDANNHTVRSFSDTVSVLTSDSSALVSSSDVTFTNGVATVQITFVTPGTQTITAQDTNSSSVTGTATTDVGTADVATHFTIDMPQNATSGTTVKGVVVAYDVQGHVVQSFNGSATLASSDSTVTAQNLTFKNGLASFSLTFGTPGTQTVTATDTADSLAGTFSTTVAAPDVATHFTVLLPQNVPNGKPVQVEILAMDAQNHVVTGYTDTANLLATGGALSASSVTFKNGFASVQATFTTAGSQTLSVTDSINVTLTSTISTNVASTGAISKPDVATHIAVLMPQNVGSGTPVSVWLVALDAQNRVVLSFADTASLAVTGGSSSRSSVTFKNGFASAQVTFSTSGSQTVTATDNALVGTASTNVAAVSVATHFTLLLPQNVTSGTPVTVEVLALDANNHLVPSYSGTASVTVSGATNPPTSATFSDGTASFQVTFSTVGQQTLNVSATSPAVSGAFTTTVAAADVATHFALVLPTDSTIGQSTSVELVALDAENHVVSNYSGSVALTSSDNSAKLPASITFVGGVAHFRVTFETAGQETLTATDAANSLAISGTTDVVSRNSFLSALFFAPLRFFGRF